MARVASVQRISKLLKIISKYYKIIYNLLCIVITYAQKCTYGFVCIFPWDKWKSREEPFVCWWSRSHMELEHSEGQCVMLTPNNSLRDWTKLSNLNGVCKCKVLIWQTFGFLCLQKKSEPHLQSTDLNSTVSIHTTVFQLSTGSEQSTWTLQCIHGYIGGIVSPFCASQPTGICDLEAEGSSKISTLSQHLLISIAPKDLANLTCSLTDRTSPPQLSDGQGDVSEHN